MIKEGRWLLAGARQLESRMRQIATGFESEVRLVHDSLIPTHAFNQDICAFEDLNCGTRLRIGCDVMTGTWEALREGRADIVVAAGEGPAGGGYKAVPVGTLQFVFCVTATHPLARLQRPLTRGDLLEHTAVVVGDGARSSNERTIGLLSGQRRIVVPHMHAKIAAQAAGLGHGFVPRACVRTELETGILVELEVEAPRPDEPFFPGLAARPHGRGAQVVAAAAGPAVVAGDPAVLTGDPLAPTAGPPPPSRPPHPAAPP